MSDEVSKKFSFDNLFSEDPDFAKIALNYVFFKNSIDTTSSMIDDRSTADQAFDLLIGAEISSIDQIGDVGALYVKKIHDRLSFRGRSKLSDVLVLGGKVNG